MKQVAKATLLLSALCFAIAPAQSAVTEFVVPSGPMITLQGGQVIEGHIVEIDQTNIVIQTNDGVARTVPRSTVETMTFETITGQKIVGDLLGWAPGIYQLATSDSAIKVYSAMPAVVAQPEPEPESVIADGDASQGGGSSNLPETTTSETAVSDDVVAESDDTQTAAALAVDETENGIADQSPEGTIGTQDAAVSPSAVPGIDVTVEHSKENGPPLAFNIELSEPSTSSVVLIYATIDGTAINGQDYEASRGVVVIKPGEQSARIEAAVLDDTEAEGQETLKLFLTVDPNVAIVRDREIIATIDDDDQG